jgi:hypothetical protein
VVVRAQQVQVPVTAPQVSAPGAAANAPKPEESELAWDWYAWDWDLLSGTAGWNGAVPDAMEASRSVGDAGEEDEDGGAGAPRGAEAGAAGESYGALAPGLNEASLDGLSAPQSFGGVERGGLAGAEGRGRAEFSLSAVEMLRVTRAGFGVRSFSVQIGGAGGTKVVESVAAPTTRTGGTTLHGSMLALSEESALAATNPYSIATSYSNGAVTSEAVKPRGAMNEVGVSLGAPVKVPGAFFRRRTVTLFGAADVQVHEDRIVSSPVHASFFALTPDQVSLLGNRGVSAAQTNAALNYLSSLTGTTARSAWRLQGLGRADVALSRRDDVVLGYSGMAVDAPAGAALGQASDAVVARGTGSLGDSHVNVQAGSVRWEHRFSSRWTNELRAQAVHDLEYESARASQPQEPAVGPGGLAPQVSIGPEGFAYGTPGNLGRTAYPDERRVEVGDTMRLRLGRHALTLGGSWSRVHERIANLTDAEGAFLYDSGTSSEVTGDPSAGGLVDWITDYSFNVRAYPNGGCPSILAAVHYFCFRTYTQGFGSADTEFVMHEFAGFAEDAMRLRKDLMVTAGVRYDYTLLPLPLHPNDVLDADLAAAGIGAATAKFPEDRNNVGPRVAAAYAPRWSHGVTAMAGYGLFYGRVPGGTVRAALNDTALPSTTLHVRITPKTETLCPQVTTNNQGFGYACAFTAAPPGVVAQTTSATLFAPGFRAPMVQRGALALEKSFARRLTVRAQYAMAYGKQLPASTDVNIAPSSTAVEYVLQGGDHYPGLHTGETFAVPLYTQRLVSQYGAVTEMESKANSYYNAGTVEAEWRGGRGLAARASYTFSRGIDDGPQQSAVPSLDSQFDPFANGYDKGLSSLQFPQEFVGALQWESRWTRGDRRAQRALSGWRVSAVGSAGSGAPYSYAVFGGTRLAGGHATINGSGGATYLPTVGRNTLRLPARGKMDLRAGREFAAGKRLRMNAFVEAFNVLNERNITGVETRAFLPGSAATIGGGTVTGATPLVFQDAAAIASEGLGTAAFGTPNSSTAGSSKERRMEFGLQARF